MPTLSPDYPAIPTAITRRESDLLAELTTMRWVLEIGSACGYSTVWMALNGAHVVAVDPHTWADTRYGFEANLRRYGVADLVQPFHGRSQEWRWQGSLFDAAFIDGDHSYENASFDIGLALRVVKPQGWIVCHDYAFKTYYGGGWPGVVKAVDELLGSFPDKRRVGTVYAVRLPPRVATGGSPASPVD